MRRWVIGMLPVVCSYCSLVQPLRAVRAQTPPSVREVLQRVSTAAGGADVEQRVTSRLAKGFVVTPGGRAPVTVYQKMPNRFLIVIDSPAGGLSRNAFDGTEAWSQNRGGTEAKNGHEVDFVRREQMLHREVRLATLFKTLSVDQAMTSEGRPATGIRAVASDGVVERFLFDQESYLLISHEVEINGKLLRSEFEDYRILDGVPVAHRVKRSRPDFAWTTEFLDVRQNVPIEESLFTKPSVR